MSGLLTGLHPVFALASIMVPFISTAADSADFPPIMDSSDIAHFFSTDDIDGLHWALTNVFRRSERNPEASKVVHSLPPIVAARGGGSTYTTEYKLRLDLEQAEYLAENLEDGAEAVYFRDEVIPAYQRVLDNIPPLESLERTGGLYGFQKADVDAGILDLYNKALHVTDFDELRDVEGNVLSLLGDSFDSEAIQRRWFGEEPIGESCSNHPGIVVVDDILSPLALSRIRQLLQESTVWYQTKMPLKFGGYAGAYIDDGLHDRILLQLAFELHKSLPRIMKDHPLKYLWAYKYDSDYSGINTHADQAAVNVNLWVTPEESNLDKESGGLVVFTAKPPEGWDFEEYNTNTEKVMEVILGPTGFANVTVPYRENRAVLFDSMLFHHTDNFKFQKGYTNRRINLTILYGDMKKGNNRNRLDGASTKEEL